MLLARHLVQLLSLSLLDETSCLGVEESLLGGAQSSRGSLESSNVVVCRVGLLASWCSIGQSDLGGGAVWHCRRHVGWRVCVDWNAHCVSDCEARSCRCCIVGARAVSDGSGRG